MFEKPPSSISGFRKIESVSESSAELTPEEIRDQMVSVFDIEDDLEITSKVIEGNTVKELTLSHAKDGIYTTFRFKLASPKESYTATLTQEDFDIYKKSIVRTVVLGKRFGAEDWRKE